MTSFRRRRTPDPARPGTVYRSKPKFGRNRSLASGPPYLSPGAAGAPVGPAGTDPDGVSAVYRDHGGGANPAGQYGQIVDDRGLAGAGNPPGNPPGDQLGPGGRPPSGPTQPAGPRGPAWLAGRRWPRPRLSLIILIVVILVIGYPLLLGLTAWTSLHKIDALSPAHKITDTPGTPGRTYLVVGSDSRADLSKAERKKLGTGSAGGQRTDTIILLHVPSGGGPTVLVSVPRDSYVPIPGRSRNKINAAYAFGGAPLLVRTLEQATGLRIDSYVETGLGGFANIVNALGGVTLCPKFNMKDRNAHINLKKGCQTMNGTTALGYSRARDSDPRGDLGRVERQRETLTAIAKKTLSPVTLIQPWKAFPAAKAGGQALTVDKGTSQIALIKFILAMRSVSGGNGLSITVPISNPGLRTSNAGLAVEWNHAKALELFKDLKADDTNAVKAIAAAQKKGSEATG